MPQPGLLVSPLDSSTWMAQRCHRWSVQSESVCASALLLLSQPCHLSQKCPGQELGSHPEAPVSSSCPRAEKEQRPVHSASSSRLCFFFPPPFPPSPPHFRPLLPVSWVTAIVSLGFPLLIMQLLSPFCMLSRLLNMPEPSGACHRSSRKVQTP